jgi:outer membrane biosynthesis protein TonB
MLPGSPSDLRTSSTLGVTLRRRSFNYAGQETPDSPPRTGAYCAIRPYAGFSGIATAGTVLAPSLCSAQQEQPAKERRVINRVTPSYPELAKKMNLEGAFRLIVTVAPNDGVKSVKPLGGSPLLVKAATDSVYKWRWVPAGQESDELVELRFHPD